MHIVYVVVVSHRRECRRAEVTFFFPGDRTSCITGAIVPLPLTLDSFTVINNLGEFIEHFSSAVPLLSLSLCFVRPFDILSSILHAFRFNEFD